MAIGLKYPALINLERETIKKSFATRQQKRCYQTILKPSKRNLILFYGICGLTLNVVPGSLQNFCCNYIIRNIHVT